MRKIQEVSIEKGMYDGQRITFSGEGDQKPGLEPGDIVVVLDEKEHPVFRRKGIDIFMKMPVSLSEALTGLKRTVKTLDGRTLVLQTEAGEVIRNGEIKSVSGEGMPTYIGNPFKKGKLIIQFAVQFPARLKPAVAESLAKIFPPKEEPMIPDDYEEVDFDEDDEDEDDEDEDDDDEDDSCNGPAVGCTTQ